MSSRHRVIFSILGGSAHCLVLKQTALCSFGKWKSTYLYNSKSLKRSRLPVPYYSNSVATNRTILRDGEIEVNPGPDASNSTVGNKNCPRKNSSTRCVKCLSCEKPVQNNHKRFICILCKDLYHAKCTGVQHNLKTIRAGKPHEWTCPRCLFTELPFSKCVQGDITSLYVDNDSTCAHRVLSLAVSRLQMIATSTFNPLCQGLVN